MTQPVTATPPAPAGEDADRWVSARVGPRGYRTELAARDHAFVADEPTTLGGTDAGATPYEYLLGALGGCMAITLRMYADRKGWPLAGVHVQLRTARSHEADCANCEAEEVGITRIERRLVLEGELTEEQRRRLAQIADRCPVKQTLARGLRMVDVA